MVQHSPGAYIFGIPVAVSGVVFYAFMVVICSPRANLSYVRRQMRAARRRGADVAHFPEAALSGYAGTDFESFAGFDWDGLSQATSEVLDCARQAGIWVVLGSAHRLGSGHKPHKACTSSTARGRSSIATTRCSARGGPDGRSGDLAHYSPGGHFSAWTINSTRPSARL